MTRSFLFLADPDLRPTRNATRRPMYESHIGLQYAYLSEKNILNYVAGLLASHLIRPVNYYQ